MVQGGTRKIVPLRKSRLAGKKPAPPPQDGTKQCPAVPTRQIRVYSPTEGVQLNPTDILNRAQDEQNRTVSSSSVDAVDSALDVDALESGNRVISSSSGGEMVTLPINAVRSVSGSSATEVDASLDLTNGFKKGVEGMIPMFNFLPPTPSHKGFNPTTANAAHPNPSGNTFPGDSSGGSAGLQFDPIDFSTLLGFSGTGTDAAQDLLRDLEELDFEQFLHSPATSSDASGSPDAEQGQVEGGEDGEVQMQGGAEQGTMDDVQLECLFESMSSKEGEVDPAIWEMLRGILSSGTDETTSSSMDKGTENVLRMTPAPTPVDGVHGSTENDPFAALAIDLPTLLASTPQGSLTTPNVISDTIPPADAFLAAGTNNLPAAELSAASGETVNAGEKEPDWQGLLDFTEMFDAFWTMVDTPAEGSAPASTAE